MKRFIVCGFLMFLLAAPCTPAFSQESEPDKKALREQRREERRQKREERKQERQNGETQKEVLPATTANAPQNTTSKNAVMPATQQSVQVQQKQQTSVKSEKEERPIIKAPATTNSSRPSQSIEKTVEQSVHTTAFESNASQSPSDDNFSSFVSFFVLAVLVIWILSKIFIRKCSHCKKYRAMIPIEETYLGRAKTERVKDSQGHISFVHYNRIQVTRECKYCGYQDRVIKTVKGDRE